MNRLRNRIQKYTLILTHIKKKHTNVQKKYKKASRTVLIPVLLQAYRSRSKIISVLMERKLPVHQRFLRILCLSIMQKSLIVWKKPDWSLSEKQTWMNLPWEVPQRLPLTASPEIHGIWNTYQAVLQVVPVLQWQQEKLIWHLVQIQADLSVSQVPTVV